MGIWESVQSAPQALRRGLPDMAPAKDMVVAAAGSISGGSALDLAAAFRRSRELGLVAASWVKESTPDRDGWCQIARVAGNIADHSLAEFSKPYTFGIPVYKYARDEWIEKSGGARAPKNVEEELRMLRERPEMMEARMALRSSDDMHGGSAGDKDEEMAHKPEVVIREFVTHGFHFRGKNASD